MANPWEDAGVEQCSRAPGTALDGTSLQNTNIFSSKQPAGSHLDLIAQRVTFLTKAALRDMDNPAQTLCASIAEVRTKPRLPPL